MLNPDEMKALQSVEHGTGMIAEAKIRSRLKRLGLIEAAPWFRKYRQMPYRATAKGHEAIREAQKPASCSACGGTGRMGPFFPGGMSTICGNCSVPTPAPRENG